jgi:hypothetical protein
MLNVIKILALLVFLDAGTKEKTFVVDYVDMIEINHKYFRSSDSGEIKKQFIQVIFWEYRKNVLLPEIKEGELTGNWYQGSDYVVIDYFTLHNNNYGLNKTSGISPYLYKDKWYTHYYDQSDKCERVVISKQIKRTQTMYDPEVLNARIVETSSRKELTKPDRRAIIKKIPKEIERLLDMEIQIRQGGD